MVTSLLSHLFRCLCQTLNANVNACDSDTSDGRRVQCYVSLSEHGLFMFPYEVANKLVFKFSSLYNIFYLEVFSDSF